MEQYKHKHSSRVYIVGAILLALITMLAIVGASSGMIGSSNHSQDIEKYSSIDELIQHTDFKLSIPNFVYNYRGKIFNISSTMGQIVEMDTNNFVYKASPLVSYNADILGLYEHTDNDHMYTIKNNADDIKFFRYRLNYPNYEHCTIVNWCTSKTTQGIIIGKVMNPEEIIKTFNIDKESMKETSQKEIYELENSVVSSDIKGEKVTNNLIYKRYNVGNKFSIELPEFNSSVNVIDEDGLFMFYLDKKLVLVIIYNDYDIDTNSFSGQSELKLADGVVMRYRSKNPFDKSHVDYVNYNNFIKTIDYIKGTIIYK